MKLLQKTNQLYFGLAAALLFFAGVLLFLIVTMMITWEQQESLLLNVDRVVSRLGRGEVISPSSPELEIEILDREATHNDSFKRVSIYEPTTDEDEAFLALVAIRNIGNQSYRIVVRQSRLERTDHLGSIAAALLLVLFVLLLGLSWINKRVSTKIWNPFYENLTRIQAYSIQEGEGLKMVESDIDEFMELNQALVKLTKNISTEYTSLKSFTENASHEIQTPLSIVQVRLEETLQEPELTEHQAYLLQSAVSATERLSRLNKSLLLLAKIENRQFETTSEVDIAQLLYKALEGANDLILTRGLHVTNTLKGRHMVLGSLPLLEILVSNLVWNAVKHNVDSGSIRLEWEEKTLRIENTGEPLNVDPNSLIQRFSKGHPSSQSLGLGLSIVSRICRNSNWVLAYTTQADTHIVEVTFTL